ncbi:hypothetical protein F4780DRAFT_723397 [Xylariomycetidae sp. FL0641]|nr:hypothetical protein F4780DRAFT_723397 [Xylariomycetidae sp. FL0641]
MTAATPKRSIVVTGANGGLGSSIVAKIVSSPDLAANYHGIYVVRDSAAAPDLLRVLQHGQSSKAHSYEIVSLDLAQVSNVREVATNINKRVPRGEIPPIHALVLSIGYIELDGQTWTEGDLDATWVVNYLSPWLLTLTLLQSMDRDEGRVVVIGSHNHDPYDKVNDTAFTGQIFIDEKWRTMIGDDIAPIATGAWSSWQESPDWKGSLRRYSAAKLCLVMMM